MPFRRRLNSAMWVTSLLVLACDAPLPPAGDPEVGLPAQEEADPDSRRAHFLVEPGELRSELEVGGDLVVLEVGMTSTAFEEEGHLPGAGFLPWSAVAARKNGLPNMIPDMDEVHRILSGLGVGDETRVVLYDRGQGLMAGRAWAVLDYAGVGRRTRILNGQLTGWIGEGGEVETGAEKPREPGELTLHPDPDRVLAGERVADMVWARSSQRRDPFPGLHLLDARPFAEYSGEVAGDEVARPGHIPGARSLPWRSTTGPDEAPFLLDTESLLALFAEAGVTPGDRIFTYCRTGGQAGHLYFVARMLGFDARFYDGSFVEWSRNPTRPVVGP